MSWGDYYRRRDVINLVLDQARKNPQAGLAFEGLPVVTEVFDTREDLALALQYKWSQILLGRINAATVEAERTPDIDHVGALADAWRTAAARNPELRALLDSYANEAGPAFHAELRAEQRMLAHAAGLAELGEPADETARIGAAFLALIRSGGQQPVRRRRPIEQLFHRLAASS